MKIALIAVFSVVSICAGISVVQKKRLNQQTAQTSQARYSIGEKKEVDPALIEELKREELEASSLVDLLTAELKAGDILPSGEMNRATVNYKNSQETLQIATSTEGSTLAKIVLK